MRRHRPVAASSTCECPGGFSCEEVLETGGDGLRGSYCVRIPSKTNPRCELARLGEDFVAEMLERRGFDIVGRNVRVGRLELDVIARRGSLVVVCEVRSRRKRSSGVPGRNHRCVRSSARVRRATAIWLRQQRLGRVHARIDAAAVVFDGPRGEPRVEYYENASYPMRHV